MVKIRDQNCGRSFMPHERILTLVYKQRIARSDIKKCQYYCAGNRPINSQYLLITLYLGGYI